MSTYVVEVIDRFEDPVSCSELIYSSVPDECRVRENRVYEVVGSGSFDQFKTFVREVLVDEISQEWMYLEGTAESAESNFDHRIDVWLKSNVLDLEEDYLLEYCEENGSKLPFEVEDLRILTRYYLTLNGADEDIVETIVRDIANPVIHDWALSTNA